MKRKTTWIAFAAVCAALLMPLQARAAGTVGSVFLVVGTSARCEGMGGACAATVNDASAVSINPAAMTEIAGQQAVFMHNETVLDLSQEYISYTSSYGGSAWGASLVYMDMGSQQAYSTTNVSQGSFRPNSYALTLAYGKQLTDNDAYKLSYGAAFKYIREKIASESGTAYAIDAGLLFKPKRSNWRVALVVQNIGTKIKLGSTSDPLPMTFRIGTAYDLPKMPLTLSADLLSIKDSDPEFHFGAEYSLSSYIRLRAGYNSDDDLDNGFTFGLGFSQEAFGLDYAFIPMGVFGDSHRFSFAAKF